MKHFRQPFRVGPNRLKLELPKARFCVQDDMLLPGLSDEGDVGVPRKKRAHGFFVSLRKHMPRPLMYEMRIRPEALGLVAPHSAHQPFGALLKTKKARLANDFARKKQVMIGKSGAHPVGKRYAGTAGTAQAATACFRKGFASKPGRLPSGLKYGM